MQQTNLLTQMRINTKQRLKKRQMKCKHKFIFVPQIDYENDHHYGDMSVCQKCGYVEE
jgi:hypothetical protein